MNQHQIIILGFDALDAALIERYGLGEQFGRTETIGTYCNPIVGEPHTLELWPSLISGAHADEHGIKAATPGGGVDWDSRLLQLAADAAAGIVPQSVRSAIGRRLRDRVGLSMTAAGEFPAETVFDSGGKAISIPNYQTAYDREHGLDASRTDIWGTITPDRSVAEGIEPQVGLETVWATLSGAAGNRLGHTLAAIQQGHDLVWTWFGLLDTIGHIQPAMDADLEARGYRLAASIVELVRETAPDDAVVVALSDHGLQDGHHTEYATLATGAASPHDEISSVLDVAGWVDRHRGGVGVTDVGYGDGVGEMHRQLEALGYA
jgi:hypothetical protein